MFLRSKPGSAFADDFRINRFSVCGSKVCFDIETALLKLFYNSEV